MNIKNFIAVITGTTLLLACAEEKVISQKIEKVKKCEIVTKSVEENMSRETMLDAIERESKESRLDIRIYGVELNQIDHLLTSPNDHNYIYPQKKFYRGGKGIYPVTISFSDSHFIILQYVDEDENTLGHWVERSTYDYEKYDSVHSIIARPNDVFLFQSCWYEEVIL